VFLGPSLSRSSAIDILPRADYLPPARQADVVSAVETYRPDVLALIDGAFGQSQSVWHKEILFALERGVRVYGAASLGALRAAELAPFGMLGVGEIYRLFASGELQDDDEVALVHAPEAEGFRALSEPLVNLRATFRLALDQGVLTPGDYELLIASARRRYFADRTLPTILGIAREAGLGAATAERLSALWTSLHVDVKRHDAEQLLELIRDLPTPLPPPAPPTFRLEHSASYETLYENERCVQEAGIDVPLRAIAVNAALHHPDFDELNFAAVNRALVMVLADTLHVEPTSSDVDAEIQRFRRRRGLEAWLVAQHLTGESFQALMHELATGRRLQRWLLVRDRGAHHTRWLLDELRLRDEYTAAVSAAAEEQAVAEAWDPDLDLLDAAELELAPLAAAHAQATGWRVDVPLATWAEEAGFESGQDLALELLRAARVRERLQAAARALSAAGLSPGSP
jgi:hypothetical protein